MKNLRMMLIVLTLLAAPASGVVVQTILNEDFTGTAGADLETLPGWTKTSTGEILISDEVIDDGQSAQYGRRDTAADIFYEYEFENVEADHYAGEYFELTLAARAMDDAVRVYLYGRTRIGSNGFTFTRVSLDENVWDPPASPESVRMYSTYPTVDQTTDVAGDDATVYLKLVCTPGVWQPPPMDNPGSRTLYYSEVSDQGPWTEVYTDTSSNGSGMWRVDYILIRGGYAPTGGLYDSWETGFLDSIKLGLRGPSVHNPGDVTGEGFVGADDLVAILTNWGASGPAVTWEMGDCAPYGDGSNPGDDFIGADDYVEVLTYWGATYGGEPVPEPTILGLLLVGGLAVLRRGR